MYFSISVHWYIVFWMWNISLTWMKRPLEEYCPLQWMQTIHQCLSLPLRAFTLTARITPTAFYAIYLTHSIPHHCLTTVTRFLTSSLRLNTSWEPKSILYQFSMHIRRKSFSGWLKQDDDMKYCQNKAEIPSIHIALCLSSVFQRNSSLIWI